MRETMKALVVKKNFESHRQKSKSVFMLIVFVIFVHDHIDKCDDDQNDKANEQRRGVKVRHLTREKGAEVRKFKTCRIEAAISYNI